MYCVDLSYAVSDKIIFRDGRIEEVTIDQISDSQLRFRSKHDKKIQQSVPTKDVYMYFIEAYGNTYVTADGKRFSGETKAADKNVDVIYLVSGKEIGVASITRYPDSISYIEKKGKKKGVGMSVNLDNSQVFMICYKNGITELVTELELFEDVSKAEETVAVEEPEEEFPQYSVIFHEVKKWDTLEKIAKKYDVNEKDIKEWNELPASLKSKVQLEIGSNLMIYLPQKNE